MVEEKVELYNYQKNATSFVLDNIDETDVLLAAAPNAGKTFMTSFIIKELISHSKRILCSIHGTNVLKRQFYNSVCNIVGFENVSIYDTSDILLYDPSKPVQIMIYQNTKQMEECVELYGMFDYLVVDEAHKFYDGTDSMDLIANEYVSGNHLLLTGSPAIFKKQVDSGEIRAKYISASLIEATHSGQYDKEIRLDVVSNDVHLTLDDYNSEGEVNQKAEKKLKNNDVVLESLLIGDFGKTIIFVKRTKQADEIEKYLATRNIDTYISHSKGDKDSENIRIFKENYSGVDNVVLIVVGRATEGFDDPNVSIIDITYTKNIDTLYQRYSRAIRQRTDATEKRYVKVVPNNGNSAEVFVHIMTAVLMLLKQEHYENFNGKNFSVPAFKVEIKKPKNTGGCVRTFTPKKQHYTNDITDNTIVIKSSNEPVSVEDLVKNENFNVTVRINDEVYEIKQEDYHEWVNRLEGKEYSVTIEKSNDKVDDCLLMETSLYSGSFFDTKNELYGLITRYATSSLQDVLQQINYTYGVKTIEEVLILCEKYNITSPNKWVENYKKISDSEKIVLMVRPWETLNLKGGKKEFSRLLGWSYGIDSIEECVNLGIKHGIKNASIWSEEYKNISQSEKIKLPSKPWELFNIDGGMNEFSRLLGFDDTKLSSEEHFRICIENKLVSIPKYQEYIEKNHNLGLYKTIWVFEDKSAKEYFEDVKKHLGVNFLSIEDTLNFCIDNNVINGSIYKEFRDKNKILHSRPWKLVNKSQLEYFEDIKNKLGLKTEKISIEETYKICLENKLTTGVKYIKYVNDNTHLDLYKAPWSVVGLKQIDFFDEIRKKLGIGIEYLSVEETFQLCVDNKLIDSRKYYDYRKENPQIKTLNEPWVNINKTIVEFFDDVKLALGYNKLTYEETIDLCVTNKLTSGPLYKKFIEENTEINFFVTPWTIKNIKQKDFFNLIKEKLGMEQYSLDEIFKICVDNELINGLKYQTYCRKHINLNLILNPWVSLGKKRGEYFLEVKKAINEKSSMNRDYRPAYLGEFSEMNKKWNTSNSKTTYERLKKDKSEWVKYHELYSNSRKSWDEIPFKEIGKIIKNRPEWVVGDFGCGENLLKTEIPNKVYSFDHVAIDETVTSCDLTNIPLDDNSLDVAVFSLSLMGTNYTEYFKEAYRTLKPMGMIIVSEPATRWENKEDQLKEMLQESGFIISGDIEHRYRFIYIKAIKI
jgi:superfamily II DNA or RNA helicase